MTKEEFEVLERAAMTGAPEAFRALGEAIDESKPKPEHTALKAWTKTPLGNWVRDADGIVVAIVVALPRGFWGYPEDSDAQPSTVGFRSPGFWSAKEVALLVDKQLFRDEWFYGEPIDFPSLPE